MPRAKLWRTVLVVAVVIIVAVLWLQVFTLTGVSGGPVRQAAARPVPLPPVALQPLPTGWVDLKIYQQTHPVWEP